MTASFETAPATPARRWAAIVALVSVLVSGAGAAADPSGLVPLGDEAYAVVAGAFEDPLGLLAPAAAARRRDLFRDAVVEHRRAIDVLASRGDIDRAHVGVIGYGLGASVAFALAAVEPRVAATVACVPPTVRDRTSLLATQTYAPRVQRPFLLLTAANSRTATPADGQALRDLLGTAFAQLKVYTSDDRLPIWYTGDAVDWFTTYLKP